MYFTRTLGSQIGGFSGFILATDMDYKIRFTNKFEDKFMLDDKLVNVEITDLCTKIVL